MKIFRIFRFGRLLLQYVAFGMLRKKMNILTDGPKRTSAYSRWALRILGGRVRIVGADLSHPRNARGRLVICNHQGYLDIVVLSSLSPFRFITSVEVKAMPLLGTISAMGGSLFVERRKPSRVRSDIASISRALRAGHDVVLFAEGTSSRGDRVLPFKKALFMAAGDAGADILPVAIRYTQVDKRPIRDRDRELLCWYGEMTFFPHLLELIRQVESFTVQVKVGRPIQHQVDSDLKEVSHRVWNDVTTLYEANPA